MEKVDILLPINSSFEETRNCIVSILQNTDMDLMNLYLLDEGSQDSRIEELMNFYVNKYSNIGLLRKEKQCGLIGNINKGLSMSENDVVIINSDTLVTHSWLTALRKAAYQEEIIAAVNPMSNFGFISGIPTSNSQINDLFTFEEYTDAFNKSKQHGVVDAPVLLGFCMYLKRNALNSVGIFDESFKRGYGDETDWFLRAKQKGFKLVITKDTYLHIMGGTSRGLEKEKLKCESAQILFDRYPDLNVSINRFLKGKPLKDVRKQMMKNLDFLRQKTPKMLKLKMLKHYISNIF
ncbi:glycosyltransferase family 2 protein [Neobacillus ginsengisoli]|uniref:GT2 family glycosyltransferase n=1 Tax=Neobacillus ginsengisoli TaxID=904295 RepID=A0ABT9XVY5_9BACI|nr:glycosyltransferase [Neobacillus ginsengisoli]MDQ0199732.1 GT2 family glycosyltransferase [Neobacillus ginsengisoli]